VRQFALQLIALPRGVMVRAENDGRAQRDRPVAETMRQLPRGWGCGFIAAQSKRRRWLRRL
jgi:hypothetical protein